MLPRKVMEVWACTTAALYTVVLGLPLITIALLSRTGRTPYKLCRAWSWLVLKTNRVKVRVQGLEKIDPDTSYIFMANHASNLDPPVVALTLKNTLRFIAKKSLARVPLFGVAIRLARMIIIDREDHASATQAVNRATKDLTGGISAFFFAEGTRSLDGKLQRFKKGGAVLAISTGLPIVPVTIIGSFALMPKFTIRVKPGTVDVIIDDPIDPSVYPEEDRDLLLERVRSVISANLEAAKGS